MLSFVKNEEELQQKQPEFCRLIQKEMEKQQINKEDYCFSWYQHKNNMKVSYESKYNADIMFYGEAKEENGKIEIIYASLERD